MAAITGSVIALGTAAYSANQQKKGAQGAANATQRANDASIAEQQRQYDLTREDQQPWMQAGQSALGQMQALNAGDFSSFKESPDYQFAFNQGLQGLDRSAAAGGMLTSGGADADRIAYGQGMASQQYGNYYNRLAGLAGAGQQTASGLGQLGANTGNNISNALANTGQARASSYQQNANTNSQLAGLVGGMGTGIANNRNAYSPQPSGMSQLQTTNNWSQLTNPQAGADRWNALARPSDAWNFGGKG